MSSYGGPKPSVCRIIDRLGARVAAQDTSVATVVQPFAQPRAAMVLMTARRTPICKDSGLCEDAESWAEYESTPE